MIVRKNRSVSLNLPDDVFRTRAGMMLRQKFFHSSQTILNPCRRTQVFRGSVLEVGIRVPSRNYNDLMVHITLLSESFVSVQTMSRSSINSSLYSHQVRVYLLWLDHGYFTVSLFCHLYVVLFTRFVVFCFLLLSSSFVSDLGPSTISRIAILFVFIPIHCFRLSFHDYCFFFTTFDSFI